MSKRKKVLLCEFSQETNSFNPQTWGIDKFRAVLYCKGAVMRLVFSLMRSPVGGMLAALRKRNAPGAYRVRSICGVALRSGSGGLVDDEVLGLFIDKTLTLIKSKGPFDGVLLSLHGATSTASYPDACGRILEAVRAAAGSGAVIAVACDMHANITQAIENNADIICGYRTYPHTDLYETGYRAARLALRKMAGEPLVTACSRVGMIVPASGYTSKSGAFAAVLESGETAAAAGEIEDFTVFQMQPWLDVAEGASCAVAIAGNCENARRAADELAAALYECRDSLWPELESVEDILRIAEANTSEKPVVLGDVADSPNAGAVGDSVFILQKILEDGTGVRTLACAADARAAQAAFDAGVGKMIRLRLGGAVTPGLSPLEADFMVKSLHGGAFKLAGPTGKGMRIRLGQTAVLTAKNVTILVCGSPMMCGDLNFYRAFGLDPTDFQLVVVKANTSFRENYESLAASIHIADSPGAAAPDLPALPYRYLPDTVYPIRERGDLR